MLIKYLSDCVYDIDYDYVKNNIIIHDDDHERKHAYNKVWSTMYNWLGR